MLGTLADSADSIETVRQGPPIRLWRFLIFATFVLTFGLFNIYLLPAVLVLVLLSQTAALFPKHMFLVTLVCSILITVEIGAKWGTLPRIGPSIALLSALFIGAVLRIVSESGFKGIVRVAAHVPMIGLWSLYIVFLLASASFSIDTRASSYSVIKVILLQLVLLMVLEYLLREPGFWPKLRNAVYLATAIVCLYALVEELNRHNIFLTYYPEQEALFRGDILRVRSTFFHPIALGTYLVLVYPFLLVDVLRRRRASLIALLGCLLLAVFLTVSRGPWLALGIETVLIAFCLAGRRMRIAGAVFASLSLFACFIAARIDLWPKNLPGESLVNPAHLTHANFDEASSEYYRIAVVRSAIDRLSGTRWVIGFGPGTYYKADVRSEYAGQDHVLTDGDCQYALTLVETGGVGLGILILLILQGALLCLRTYRRANGYERVLASACLASVVGFALSCVTSSMFLLFPLNFLFWMAISLACHAKRAGSLQEGI